MKVDISNEQRFIAEVDAFRFVEHDIGDILRSLDGWLAHFDADLQTRRLDCDGLTARSMLARHTSAINQALRDAAQSWPQQWAALAPARALADYFDDKALLLVFGKFNAGKSAFCNFLADRFAAQGKAVQYFHLDAGRIVETAERLKEGAVETTARLQGVRLGENLVLLDTPGLHSMTPENAALTQRFTDGADAVLWLTSSSSPGQVQELDDIGRELHRGKPLLPIVTRSDAYDEDEVDGEIVKRLCNKTAQNRALQEADVKVRAQDKLVAMDVDAALLKAPLSVSVHMAREHGDTASGLSEAGFERLYAALLAIAEATLAYKRRKPAEILLHHLEENVLGALARGLLPMLDQFDTAAQEAVVLLETRQERIASAMWRAIMPTLAGLLETHAASRDVSAVRTALSHSIWEAFSQAVSEQLADYLTVLDVSLAQIDVKEGTGFEDIVIDGADEIVGVDYQRLHEALVDAIGETLSRLARHAAQSCSESISRLVERTASLRDTLRFHEQRLRDLRGAVRSITGEVTVAHEDGPR